MQAFHQNLVEYKKEFEEEMNMEHGLKMLLLAAGVIVTMGVIVLGFMFFRSGKATATGAMDSMEKIASEFSDSEKTIYDGVTVAGTEVINVVNKFSEDSIGIKVITKKDRNGKWYNYSAETPNDLTVSSNQIKDAKEINNIAYINPTGNFDGEVVRDDNKAVVGIVFTQK